MKVNNEIFIGESNLKDRKVYCCKKDKLKNKNAFEVFKFK